MASNSVPVEKSSCRYLDGTQHIDIAAELFNTGNTVENLEVDGLIQIIDGLTYIPLLVPEQLPASEYEQLSPAADASLSYQMTSSSLPASNPDAHQHHQRHHHHNISTIATRRLPVFYLQPFLLTMHH